ncbi:uncharacterized protein C7orf57 homolog [Osmerus eperlanus]|uniref:uncharacterized protein C7orf57 homolog n=1 Tax=Osmerus eperlanus TaxID=29151 RepID=UPI002E0D15D7
MSAAPNHRRTKPGGIKPGVPSNGVVGPTSQIPGLSQIASESAPEARTSGRRVGIFASDSEYVKLAKQGGQKGLLSHDDIEAENQSPQNYNPSDWFSGPPGSQRSKSGSQASSPDMMSPDGNTRSQSKGSRHSLAAPFGTDNCSSWERETGTFAQGKEKVHGAAPQLDGLSLTQANKYKRTSYDKKVAPVSMSKLLSFGYVEEENKSPNDDDASSVTSEQTSTIAAEEDDDLE